MKQWLVILLLFGGMGAVVYPFQIVKTFGHMRWAEEKIGSGGTYTAWRLIGIGMIIASYYSARYL
jgi:hypothetical protein